MIKKILFSIAKTTLYWAGNYIYDYVDQDKDGKISKEEFTFIYNQLKDLLKTIRSLKK